MEIQRSDDGKFVIPCREWAAVHMGLPITYEYKTKRNAQRAACDPKRNTTTRLCHYAEQLFTRVCVLETTLLSIKLKTDSYDFGSDDVFGTGSDGISANGGDEGASDAACCSGEGDAGAVTGAGVSREAAGTERSSA